MQATACDELKAVLRPLVASWEADSLADDWVRRSSRAIAKVDKILAAARLTIDAVMAEALALRLDDIYRKDRMGGKEGPQPAYPHPLDAPCVPSQPTYELPLCWRR